jgi:hypothetical protein
MEKEEKIILIIDKDSCLYQRLSNTILLENDI